MVLRIGFVVNPLAGIGGPAGLKGSDDVAEEAAERGYEPTAHEKARRFLVRLKKQARPGSVRIFAAPGVLGESVTRETGWKTGSLGAESFDEDPFATDAVDTKRAAVAAVELEMDMVVFVGGDGTARDVAEAVGERIAVLGVPAGVKMFSECFCETPEASADLIAELAASHAEGDVVPTRAGDLLDLDEEGYREGRVEPMPQGVVRVPSSPRIMAAKCSVPTGNESEQAAAGVLERMEEQPGRLYVLGSGSTVMALKRLLGVEGSLIGLDLVTGTDEGWRLVDKDVDAHRLEQAVGQAEKDGQEVVLVVAPIGGQGFVIGRGTGPLTPRVVQAALPDGVWVVATKEKLASLRDKLLHVDTGDPELDREFPSFLRVTTAPGQQAMARVAKVQG